MAFCVGDKEFFLYRSEWNSVVSLSHIFSKLCVEIMSGWLVMMLWARSAKQLARGTKDR